MPLVDRMIPANGYHAFAFVDLDFGDIVYVNTGSNSQATLSYDEFDVRRERQ